MMLRLIVFCALAFGLSLLLGSVQPAAPVPLAQWGPGLAVFAMGLLFRRERLRVVFAGPRTPPDRYLAAIFVPVVATLVTYLVYNVGLRRGPTGIAGPWITWLWMPLGAIGEELGWRGYLHKRLNNDLVGPLAALVAGALWAAWQATLWPVDFATIGWLVLLLIAQSAAMHALLADAGFDVAVAALFRWIAALCALLFAAAAHETAFVMTHSLVWASVAVLVIAARHALGRSASWAGA